MATLRDFDPEIVQLNWAGIDFTGYAPDTFITVTRSGANTLQSVGADGSVGITKVADKTATIEVTLMQTSSTHRYLAAVQAAQDVEGATLFRAGLSINDPSGGTFIKADGVHISAPPELSLGSDQAPKTWTFFAERLTFTELPAGFSAPAGEATRIANALDGVKAVTDKVKELIV